VSGGDDDRPEREKRSWREIDRMRDGSRASSEPRPRAAAAEARARSATKQYLKEIDGLFAPDKAGSEAARFAHAMRDAHGTPGLAAACRAYRDALGVPDDPTLLSLFLDSDAPDLISEALEQLLALHRAGNLEVSSGLRSQLRILAQHADDRVAEGAEDLLEAI
jgi:hypothetical protein